MIHGKVAQSNDFFTHISQSLLHGSGSFYNSHKPKGVTMGPHSNLDYKMLSFRIAGAAMAIVFLSCESLAIKVAGISHWLTIASLFEYFREGGLFYPHDILAL